MEKDAEEKRMKVREKEVRGWRVRYEKLRHKKKRVEQREGRTFKKQKRGEERGA